MPHLLRLVTGTSRHADLFTGRLFLMGGTPTEQLRAQSYINAKRPSMNPAHGLCVEGEAVIRKFHLEHVSFRAFFQQEASHRNYCTLGSAFGGKLPFVGLFLLQTIP